MWVQPEEKGEFNIPIGATVQFSDTGQIQLVDDEGRVSQFGRSAMETRRNDLDM